MTVLTAGCITFLGCESNDSAGLQGQWQAESLTLNTPSGIEKKVTLDENWQESLTLNGDGSFSYASKQLGVSRSGTGNWIQNEDGTLTLSGENIGYGLEGDSLVFKGSVPEGSYKVRYRKISG
jgi:hypothetical protein